MKEHIRSKTKFFFSPEQKLGPLPLSSVPSKGRELCQEALGKKSGEAFWSCRQSVPKLASERSLMASSGIKIWEGTLILTQD